MFLLFLIFLQNIVIIADPYLFLSHTHTRTKPLLANFLQELVELAKSMNELRDMFQDMAALLEMQGENLNSIEGNMDTAQNYVDRGITHLDKANQYQKKKRKQMCCCMIIALGLAVGILTPILITALNNSR